MKLLFENWRNHLNEGLSPKGLEERYEKFFNPKGWYFESDQELGEGAFGKVLPQSCSPSPSACRRCVSARRVRPSVAVPRASALQALS